MKRTFAILMIAPALLAAALASEGQRAPDGGLRRSHSDAAVTKGVEEELKAVKRAMGEAYVKGDGAALDRIYADEYVVTDPDGSRRSKADEIRAIRSSTRTYESSSYGDVTVRIYGDTAVVIGTGLVVGRGPDGPFKTRYRSTNVFVRREGRWRAVAAHISGVEKL